MSPRIRKSTRTSRRATSTTARTRLRQVGQLRSPLNEERRLSVLSPSSSSKLHLGDLLPLHAIPSHRPYARHQGAQGHRTAGVAHAEAAQRYGGGHDLAGCMLSLFCASITVLNSPSRSQTPQEAATNAGIERYKVCRCCVALLRCKLTVNAHAEKDRAMAQFHPRLRGAASRLRLPRQVRQLRQPRHGVARSSSRPEEATSSHPHRVRLPPQAFPHLS